jgi:hypothetical protein
MSAINWNFQMSGYSIGNGTIPTVPDFGIVVDSGGPNTGLPSGVVVPYFNTFGGSPSGHGSHTYPCSLIIRQT